MTLCEYCQNVHEWKWNGGPVINGGTLKGERHGGWIQHHTSYGDLRASADGGCELCSVLRQGLRHWADWISQQRNSPRQQESDVSDGDAYLLRKDLEIDHKYFVVLKLQYPGGSPFYIDHVVFEGFYYRRCLPDLIYGRLIYPDDITDDTMGASFTFKTLIG
jgi:hypothetical protein